MQARQLFAYMTCPWCAWSACCSRPSAHRIESTSEGPILLHPCLYTQVNRILAHTLNTKRLKDRLMETSQLIAEVNTDFARAMNKVS